MLYVAAREVEGVKELQTAVFTEPREAWDCYEQARRVSDNDPDEFGDGDPSVVFNCWLYLANTDDQVTAEATMREGRAVLVASYENLGLHDGEIP